MFGLFKKKEKKRKFKLGVHFELQGKEFICVGANGGAVEMAIIQRAKLIYAKNKLDGLTHGINPRWVASYTRIKYYEDDKTWEVI
ncbi:hypothetical protein MRP26_01620 [Bacillus sp. CCB-MMP212]|uniref:hypothetical protein n=1 Tax=Bacillus sp. CCB-MMP212 TaxID=2928002 RepID=UPI001F620560|nr:hypothetical protein [Bacillus sp. CCB-MMP212]MCI4247658.1 hypothetical protein [Bacillus sp. CCB-MMP212]